MTAWFSNWFGTEYYKMLYGHRDLSEARPLVQAILRETTLAVGSNVWDMACGRGRHLKWFEEAGMKVHGSDLSEDSIVEAGENLDNAVLQVHDMREAPPFHGMDLTVNLFTSIGYFESEADDRAILGHAFTSLKQGGYFVLDFMNTDRIGKTMVPRNEHVNDGVVFNIVRELKDGLVTKSIQVNDHGEKHEFMEQVRAYGRNELAEMVRDAGFAELDIHGKDMSESVQDSERVVILARKS